MSVKRFRDGLRWIVLGAWAFGFPAAPLLTAGPAGGLAAGAGPAGETPATRTTQPGPAGEASAVRVTVRPAERHQTILGWGKTTPWLPGTPLLR